MVLQGHYTKTSNKSFFPSSATTGLNGNLKSQEGERRFYDTEPN